MVLDVPILKHIRNPKLKINGFQVSKYLITIGIPNGKFMVLRCPITHVH